MSRRRRRNRNEKNRIFAAIMAVFFGGFGVHKFYLNDPGAGILYIFIFIISTRFFPVSFLLGWIDALRLFTMSPEEFDRKYNKNIVRDEDYYDPRKSRRESRSSRRDPRRSKRPSPAPRAIQKANPFKKSGIKKYKEFDLQGAIEDFKEGLKINNRDVALHFNLACAYSLTEKKDQSFHHLSQAVALGFNDFDRIQNHDDLAFMRIQPEFEEFKKNGYVLSRAQTSASQESKATPAADEVPKNDVLLSQLNKLAELRKKGLLTEEEFSLERKKLLRQ